MRIHNVRFGFANNSSSSHSFIVLKDGIEGLADYESVNESGADLHYGWGQFVLSTPKAKRHYLLSGLFSTIFSEIWNVARMRGHDEGGSYDPVASNKDEIISYIQDITQFPKDEVEAFDYTGGIDHQSEINFPFEQPKTFDENRLHLLGTINFGTLVRPNNFMERGISKDFFREFAAWVLQDRVVILGGNDNDGGHALSHLAKSALLGALGMQSLTLSAGHGVPGEGAEGSWAKKDSSGMWTIFNPGASVQRRLAPKVRFSFDGEAGPIAHTPFDLSDTPELVDLKITDFCQHGCTFCYQGSTTRGKHAPIETVESVVLQLVKAGTFEIAIGGGEPTMHPDFVRIVGTIRATGIVPNFTSFDASWLSRDRADEILNCIGSWAVSVTSAAKVREVHRTVAEYVKKTKIEEIEARIRSPRPYHTGRTPEQIEAEAARLVAELKKELKKIEAQTPEAVLAEHSGWRSRLNALPTIQYVIGTATLDEFDEILKAAKASGMDVTILGYKHTGRGPKFKQFDNQGWFARLKKAGVMSFNVDTACIAQFPEILKDRPSWMYHTDEGRHTFYIDAVTNRCGASSYEELHPLDGRDVIQAFQEIQRRKGFRK